MGRWLTRRSWRAQVALLLVTVIAATLAIALAGAGLAARATLERQAAARALAIARSVASDPRYAAWVGAEEPHAGGPVQAAAEAVRVRTGALYVVVADARGIRYSHPNAANIGARVSTDPSGALSGQDVSELDRGTLGQSARGKVPLRDAGGAIIGAVSVGVDIDEVDAASRPLMVTLLGLGGLAFAAGALALVPVGSRLRAATHGLDSDELADLLREHTAVIEGALDGVISVDPQRRVRGSNDAARRLLNSPAAEPVGVQTVQPSAEEPVVLPEQLAGLLEPGEARTTVAVRGSRVVEVRALPVERGGRDLGWVLVLRDRTDLDELGRELEATRALTDALRAQNHEHANQLHALTGLVRLGKTEDAASYLADLTAAGTWAEAVHDPYLVGLLAGKEAAASEAGVSLRLGLTSWVAGRLTRPLDGVTVVGNLIDNAVRAAACGARRPAWVEVTLLSDGPDLEVHVLDSGDGVPPASASDIFTDGWTTKSERGHGIGLALARATARRDGGDVSLVAARGDAHGAAFRARLRGAVEGREDR